MDAARGMAIDYDIVICNFCSNIATLVIILVRGILIYLVGPRVVWLGYLIMTAILAFVSFTVLGVVKGMIFELLAKAGILVS